MTATNEDFGTEVERNVRALISKLEESERTKILLQEDYRRLETQLQKAHAELVELQGKYNNLQLAQANIHLSKGDIKNAKRKMTEIINQIDNCIATLSSE